MPDKKPITLRDLYPDLPDEVLAEIEDAFDRYLALVWRIHERLEQIATDVESNRSPEAEALPRTLEK